MNVYLQSLAGGILIGASTVMLLLFNGRIAGVSGIVGRLAQGVGLTSNLAFMLDCYSARWRTCSNLTGGRPSRSQQPGR